MTTDEEQMFKELGEEMVADTANELLDRQVARTRTWMGQRRGNGESDSLYDLIKYCLKEPNQRRHVISAYCAALVRLVEIEDGGNWR